MKKTGALALVSVAAVVLTSCGTMQKHVGVTTTIDGSGRGMAFVVQKWAESTKVTVVSSKLNALDGELVFKTGQGSDVAIRYSPAEFARPAINQRVCLQVVGVAGHAVSDDYLRGVLSLVIAEGDTPLVAPSTGGTGRP